MRELTVSVGDSASGEIVPLPRRRRKDQALQLNAVQVIRVLGLLPLALSVVGFAALRRCRLPPPDHRRGRPLVDSDASVLLISLLARLWQLSSREVGLWLSQWPALAPAWGLPAHRVIAPSHFTRRMKTLGADPFWLLSRALVWRDRRRGLRTGRDVVVGSSLLAAWSKGDRDADWSFSASCHGDVFGDKGHVLLDRAARPPLFFLLSPTNTNDLPFADPLLWLGRFLLALPIRVGRADGARPTGHPSKELVRCIITEAPFGPECFFAAAKRSDGVDTRDHVVGSGCRSFRGCCPLGIDNISGELEEEQAIGGQIAERRRRRLSVAEKLRLVNLARHDGTTAAAREIGVSRQTASYWLGRYEEGGSENLRTRPRGKAVPRTVTPAVRARLLALTDENPRRSAAKVARVSAAESGEGIHRSTVWAVLKKGGSDQALAARAPFLRAGGAQRPLARRSDRGRTDRRGQSAGHLLPG